MADNGKGSFGGREVVIVEAVRTPIGRGHPEKGYYKDVHPSNLLAKVYGELIERAGIDPAEVGDVIAGCVQQFGEQAVNIGRNAWLEAGLPIETPATTIDRQCGSAQQAVNFAAALIAAGVHDVAIGSGVEHMGRISFADGYEVRRARHAVPAGADGALRPRPAGPLGRDDRRPVGDLRARSWTSSACARSSSPPGRPRRAASSARSSPSSVNGDTYDDRPGHARDDRSRGSPTLKPAFKEDGKITAGNSSQISDGAAAVLLMAREKADELGLTPRARIVDQTTVGVDPVIMLTGPIPATRKILERNGMTIDDVDLIEINEAFASVVGAWRRELDPDMDRVNVNGGAIALGHPLGSTGARLLTTLLHELERSDKELGLVTMCCGGGIGTGTLIQRI